MTSSGAADDLAASNYEFHTQQPNAYRRSGLLEPLAGAGRGAVA
jgi:hypothetical protein